MKDVWMKVLELLDRLMNAGAEGDALAEAVLEGVKNVLLVMDGTGYLARDEATATATAAGHESHIPPPPVLTEGDIGAAAAAAAAAAAEKESVDGNGSEEKKQKQKEKNSFEEDSGQQIWPETVRRLDRFLPGLVQELFPPPPPPPPPDPTEARKAETSDESQARPEDATS
jgi:hypothetical protein